MAKKKLSYFQSGRIIQDQSILRSSNCLKNCPLESEMCIECEDALNLEFRNLKKREKRFENDDKREKETPRSLLEELEENASKNCPHWSDNAKNFFVSLYYFGSK